MAWVVVEIKNSTPAVTETDSADSADSALRRLNPPDGTGSIDSVLGTDASRSTKTLSDAEIDHIARAFA